MTVVVVPGRAKAEMPLPLSFRSEARNLIPPMHNYYVYILTNQYNKVMYVGVTNNLERRLQEHRMKLVPGFTEKYNVDKLVYFEETRDIVTALEREKEIKRWRREKKNALVAGSNPDWMDLSYGL